MAATQMNHAGKNTLNRISNNWRNQQY